MADGDTLHNNSTIGGLFAAIGIGILITGLVWSCAEIPSDALEETDSPPLAIIVAPSGEPDSLPSSPPENETEESPRKPGGGMNTGMDGGDHYLSHSENRGSLTVSKRKSPTREITVASGSSEENVLLNFMEGDQIRFEGYGYDADDDTLEGKALNWTSSIDGVIGTGRSFLQSELSVGEHKVVLTVIDSDGETGQDSIRIEIEEEVTIIEEPANVAPVVEILSPGNGANIMGDVLLLLEGRATDEEDGNLGGASLEWTSDRAGNLGTGTEVELAEPLSIGSHLITLTATDSEGATSSDQIDITVEEVVNVSPVVEILSPADGDSLLEDVDLILNGLVEDAEDGTLSGDQLSWSSSLDGELGTGSEVDITGQLSIGDHEIILTAYDSQEAAGRDTVEITIIELVEEVDEVVNSLPVAEIISLGEGLTPGDGLLSVLQDVQLILQGTGTDEEDGTLTGETLQWSSSIDGDVGTGSELALETPLSIGTHTISLTATDSEGATHTDSVELTVEALNIPPVAEITTEITDTIPEGAQLILQGSGSDEDGELTEDSYQWSSAGDILGTGTELDLTGVLGIGSHTITFTVTDSDGATDSDSIEITIEEVVDEVEEVVNSLPIAEIISLGEGLSPDDGLLSVLQNVPLVLQGNGIDEEDGELSGTSLAWSSSIDGELGSGNKLALETPLSVGTHTISLTATDSKGATHTDSVELTVEAVNIPPVAEITTEITGTITEGAQLILQGSGSDEDGELTEDSYQWSSAGEILGTGTELDLTGLLGIGGHTITFTVTDSDGATDSDSVEITIEEVVDEVEEVVNSLPIAEIISLGDGLSPDDGLLSVLQDVQLILQGTGTDEEDGELIGTSLAWSSSIDGELGTGNELALEKPLSLGTHTITLTATDSEGATHTDSVEITIEEVVTEVVNTLPVAEITSVGDGLLAGDGLLTVLQDVQLILQGTGTDEEDGTLSGVALQWSSSIDGNLGTGEELALDTPLSIGTHTIFLTATDSEGASHTDSIEVEIEEVVEEVTNSLPIAEILSLGEGLSLDDGLNVFQDVQLVLQGAGTDEEDGQLIGENLQWGSSIDGDLGTGSELALESPLSIGTHTITLTAIDNEGATHTDSIEITIEEVVEEVVNTLPVAEIISLGDGLLADDGLLSVLQDVQLLLQGTGTDEEDGTLSGDALQWSSSLDGDLGAGSELALETSLSIGTHTITLTVTDSDGATATDSIELTIEELNIPPVAEIITDITGTLLEDTDLILRGSGTDEDGELTEESYRWSSAGEILGTGTELDLTDLLDVGTHTITFTVTDSDGATDSDSIEIGIEALNTAPEVAITSLTDGLVQLVGSVLTLQGTAMDEEDGDLSSTMVWRNQDGQLGTGNDLSVNDLVAGNHTITLSATDSKGAVGTASVDIRLHTEPTITLNFEPENLVLLEGDILNATAEDAENGDLTASLEWLDGEEIIATGGEADLGILGAGEHVITLRVSDDDGVTVTEEVGLRINASPVAEITTDFIEPILEDTELILRGSGIDEDGELTDDSYQWTDSEGKLLGSGAELDLTGRLSLGAYTIRLTVTDSDGATDTDTVEITIEEAVEEVVNSLPVAEIISVGDGLTLENGMISVQQDVQLTLQGTGTDEEDGSLSGTSLVWRSSLDDELGTGGELVLEKSLSIGNHKIILTATDSEGATHSDTVEITVDEVVNSLPTAEIISLGEGLTPDGGTLKVLQDVQLTLLGTGTDEEDNTLSGSALQWSSSIDGELGTGTEVILDIPLSEGSHTISLTVTDSDGGSHTDEISLIINAKPDVKIVKEESSTSLIEIIVGLTEVVLTKLVLSAEVDDGIEEINNASLEWTDSEGNEFTEASTLLDLGEYVNLEEISLLERYVVTLTYTDRHGVVSSDDYDVITMLGL